MNGPLLGFASLALAGGFMLLLRLGSAQSKNAPAVTPGGAMLGFTAPDAGGRCSTRAGCRS